MPHRYAVLWETSPELPNARPAGLVVEQDDFVLVEARNELGIPPRYDQPFLVTGPDMLPVRYRPGHDPQYFDQVILDLSRRFIIGKEGSVGEASEGVILRLLALHVFRPLRAEQSTPYCESAITFPSVAALNKRKFYTPAEPEYVDDPTAVPATAGVAVPA